MLNPATNQSTREDLKVFMNQLGFTNQLETVLDNLDDLLDLHSGLSARSTAKLPTWQDDYLTRVFNPEKRRKEANRAIRAQIESLTR